MKEKCNNLVSLALFLVWWCLITWSPPKYRCSPNWWPKKVICKQSMYLSRITARQWREKSKIIIINIHINISILAKLQGFSFFFEAAQKSVQLTEMKLSSSVMIFYEQGVYTGLPHTETHIRASLRPENIAILKQKSWLVTTDGWSSVHSSRSHTLKATTGAWLFICMCLGTASRPSVLFADSCRLRKVKAVFFFVFSKNCKNVVLHSLLAVLYHHLWFVIKNK